MAEDRLETGIDFDVRENGVSELATGLSNLSDAMGQQVKAAAQVAKAVDQYERSLVGVTKAAREANKAVSSIGGTGAKSESTLASEFARQQRNNIHPGLAASEIAREQAARIRAKFDEEKITAELREQLDLRRQAVQRATDLRKAQSFGPKLETPTGAGSAAEVAARFQASGLVAALGTRELEEAKNANLAAAKAAMEHANRLTNLRYSLYDVRNSLALAGTATLGFNLLIVKAAMDYESAMAQISRTSGITGDALNGIREDFVDLAQTIPTTFSDLAEIGTLGGQLNIPAQNLADFTKVVAQFTATTNVSVEQSATAFGRLDALLDDVNGNYEALGSSILEVGVNSVATETEIIATTNQITAAAQQAGFAAKEIIGLAASYASLGVAPEASRGTTIRLFSTINTAVSEANDNLDQLARLAGMSAKEFSKAWEDASGDTFLKLIEGMQKASENGERLETTIRGMGITAVRDINALLKLAQNADIVGANFGYAASGFDEATALGQAFEIQAATLESKLQKLVNSLQALFATLGSSGIPVIGGVVDVLTGFAGWLEEISQSPFAQWIAGTIGAVTLLGGVIAILAAGIVGLGAAGIAAGGAISTIKYEILQLTGGATGATAAVNGLTTSFLGSAAATRALRVGLLSLGIIGAVAVGVGIVAEAWTAVADSMRSAADVAKDTYGDMSDVTAALQADTKAYKETGNALGQIEGQLTITTKTSADWAEQLRDATGAQVTLGDSATVTTSEIQRQTFAIGESTAALIANKLAANEQVQELFQLNSMIAEAGAPTLDTQGYISSLVKNDIAGAEAALFEWIERYRSWEQETGDVVPGAVSGFSRLTGEINKSTEGIFEAASATQQINNAVLEAAGVSSDAAAGFDELSGELEETSGAAQVASDRLNELRDSVSNAYARDNSIIEMANDFYALAEGIVTGGTAFDLFSRAGIENTQNLQAAVASSIAAGETMGMSATQSVAVLFTQLQQMGVDTANLLARVANAFPGVSVAGVQTAMKSLSPTASRLSTALGQVGQQARAAGSSLGRGKNSTAGGAKKAKEEIVTLLDYAGDLSGVFGRMFDLEFGSALAADKITSGWAEVAKSTEEAESNVRSIRATMQGIAAEQNDLRYFLGVAEAYGDELRAVDIRAKLAELDAELADKSADLRDEQNKTNKTLNGNSEAAVANRKTITGMVESYQDLLEQYAKSGMSQADLGRKAQELKQQFIQQATQLGYNRSEVERYAVTFDNLALAISRVPRNITIAAQTSAAEQALAEFAAKARQKGEEAGRNYGGGFNSGAGGVGPSINFDPGSGYALGVAFGGAIGTAARKAMIDNLNTIKSGAMAGAIGANPNLRFYKSGGYTGNLGVNKEAGIVHGREFVVNAPNTQKFRPMLEAMNRGQMPMMVGGGGGTQVMELSAYDRKLLAAAGNVSLNIDGRTVAQATNSANFVSATRGSN